MNTDDSWPIFSLHLTEIVVTFHTCVTRHYDIQYFYAKLLNHAHYVLIHFDILRMSTVSLKFKTPLHTGLLKIHLNQS